MVNQSMENKTCDCSNNLLQKINQIQEFINGKLLDITEAECSRINNEDQRVKNENSRKDAECERVTNEETRQDGYTKFSRLEDQYASNEKGRQSNELDRINSETIREHAENCRKNAETFRQEFEKSRQLEENKRVASEITRINNESSRITTENNRVISEDNRKAAEDNRIEAEHNRVSNEDIRVASENQRINNENLRKQAEEARVNAENIRIKNNIGAENVNAELSGTKINITNRKGETKSLELVDIDEHVTVKLKSEIEGLSISGIKLNVFRNHGETPETYTTNDQGIATFSVTRGTYYEIHFPDASNAQSVSPIGYTATLPVRTIEVTYKPASEGPQEHIVIETKKVLLDGTNEVFPNIDFTIQIADGEIQKFSTNANGQYELDVPIGKKYKVIFSSQWGLYTITKLTKEFTASISNRIIRLIYYKYKSGVFVVTDDGQEYTLDQFKEQNIDKTKAKMIAVYEKNLIQNNGIIYASIEDLSTANYPNKQWCNQKVLFKDIPENGNDSNAMYYYDGNGQTNAILQEAKERLLVCEAASYAHNKQIAIGGNTMYGYLPSIGQMYIFIQNDTEIDNILKYIVGDTTKTVANQFRNIQKWTSSQNSNDYAWGFRSDVNVNYKTGNYSGVACFYAY